MDDEESGYLDVEGGGFDDDDMAHEAGYVETQGFEEDDEGRPEINYGGFGPAWLAEDLHLM
jgi:hypothetical protein